MPPFVGRAVKVTEVPAQTGLAEVLIDMPTGSNGFTVIEIGVEVAGLFVAQVAFEVRSQVTASPFDRIYE